MRLSALLAALANRRQLRSQSRALPRSLRLRERFVALAVALCGIASHGALVMAQTVHTLVPNLATVHVGNFNAALKPVLTVDSGDIVMLEAACAIEPEIVDRSGIVPPSAVPESVRTIYRDFKDRGPGPTGHVLTGPVAVRGAEPGDVLEIRFLDIDLAVPYGYNLQRPGSGVLPDEFNVARQRIMPIDLAAKTATVAPGVVVPVNRPFFGVAGVAPPASAGRVSSAPPGTHAGNLDNKDLVAGSTLYVPVHVPGALFSAGDGHAAQGHGEVNLTAIETGLKGRFQLIVRKDMKLKWPRAETPTHWMVMGLDANLEQALKLAVGETVDFITARFPNLTRDDAYVIASVAVDYHVTQAVDGTKGIHGMIPKGIFAGR